MLRELTFKLDQLMQAGQWGVILELLQRGSNQKKDLSREATFERTYIITTTWVLMIEWQPRETR